MAGANTFGGVKLLDDESRSYSASEEEEKKARRRRSDEGSLDMTTGEGGTQTQSKRKRENGHSSSAKHKHSSRHHRRHRERDSERDREKGGDKSGRRRRKRHHHHRESDDQGQTVARHSITHDKEVKEVLVENEAAQRESKPSLVADREKRAALGMEWMTSGRKPTEKPNATESAPRKEEESFAQPTAPVGLSYPTQATMKAQEERGGGEDKATKLKAAGGVVGDGGASWRLKALRRAQERAKEQGRSLSDTAAEHWGSLKDLTKDITRDTRSKSGSSSYSAERVREGGRRIGGIEGGYRRTNSTTGSNSKLSWRKRERGRDHDKSQGETKEEREKLLSAASKGLNKFSGDGSFLDTFAKMEERREDKERPTPTPTPAPAPAPEASAVAREREPSIVVPKRPQDQPQHSASALDDNTEANTAGPSSHGDAAKNNNLKMADLLRQRLKSGGRGSAGAGATGRLPSDSTHKREKEVVLPTVNARGDLISQGYRGGAGGNPSGQGRFESHDKEGKRVSYFADDNMDLQALVRQQKFGEADNVDNIIMNNIAKRNNFKEAHLAPDEEYDNDATLSIIGQVSNKKRSRMKSDEERSLKERQRQISAYQRADRAQQQCMFCLSNPKRPKHLVVAIGQMAYLRMPLKRSIADGHCLIVPIEHIPSTRVADDNTQIDIRNFKKSLIQLFASEGKSVIFMELAKGLDKNRSHTIVEAVPVPTDRFDQAPIFFKQAFDEMSSDWDQHHSKRLIETGPKGLQEKIPPNFAYFFVEFGLKRGFVHVIDNEDKFKHDFGSRILSGLLSTLPRGNRIQAEHFKEKFKPFDWTAQLV